MKQISHIRVEIYDTERGITEQKDFGYQQAGVQLCDEFFNFLINEGFYDDIQVTKQFSVPKTVMKRLKGKE